VRGDEPERGLLVVALAHALGQLELLLRGQEREAGDLAQVVVQRIAQADLAALGRNQGGEMVFLPDQSRCRGAAALGG